MCLPLLRSIALVLAGALIGVVLTLTGISTASNAPDSEYRRGRQAMYDEIVGRMRSQQTMSIDGIIVAPVPGGIMFYSGVCADCHNGRY